MLYDSIHAKLLALPDEMLVYPAHGAGSLCGKALSKETVSTLGEQRRSNYALQPMSKETFIAVVTADQPDAPAYFNYDAVLNSQERLTLDQALANEMNPLSLESVLGLQAVKAGFSITRDLAECCRKRISAGSMHYRFAHNITPPAGNAARSNSPDRDYCGSGPGAGGGHAPGAHWVRPCCGVFERRIAQP